MALQFIATDRDGWLDAITASVGASALIKIYSGSVPANVAASLGAAVLLVSLPCSATFAHRCYRWCVNIKCNYYNYS